jgi:hypothetical protein
LDEVVKLANNCKRIIGALYSFPASLTVKITFHEINQFEKKVKGNFVDINDKVRTFNIIFDDYYNVKKSMIE